MEREGCNGVEKEQDGQSLVGHTHLVEFPELIPQLLAALVQSLAL